MKSCKIVLKQVLSCGRKMQKNYLQGSWDCLGKTGKQWWDGEREDGGQGKLSRSWASLCAHGILTWGTGESSNRGNRKTVLTIFL